MKQPASESATYVFCLVQSARSPSLRGVPESIPGANAVRVVSIERGVWAVVADLPRDRFAGDQFQRDLQDLEVISRHALAHATIVEFFFQRAPVIPLKLFTLFSNDERARRHLLKRRAGLRKLFAGLRGFEEWGVRITAQEPDVAPVQSSGSGRGYLETKKRLNDVAGPSRSAVREAQGALATLSRLAAKTRREAFPPPGRGRPFVAGASFLVKARRRGEWKKLVSALRRVLEARGHKIDVSGPWPPYHFAG